jgi:hypothetical protein
MNILDVLKELWNRNISSPGRAAVSPEYSYRIFWAKQALNWSLDERGRILKELESIIDGRGFEANKYRRRFRLEAFDDRDHAGASLLELHSVLVDLDRIEKSGGLE